MVTHYYFLLSYACWEFAYSQHLYLLKVKRERNTVFQQLNMIEFLKVLSVCVWGGHGHYTVCMRRSESYYGCQSLLGWNSLFFAPLYDRLVGSQSGHSPVSTLYYATGVLGLLIHVTGPGSVWALEIQTKLTSHLYVKRFYRLSHLLRSYS